MHHWSFILIECCPRRSPLSASTRLPGGSLRKANSTAASISCNLMSARCQMSPGRRRERPVSHNFSVSRSAKLLITSQSQPAPLIRQTDNICETDNWATCRIPSLGAVRRECGTTYLAGSNRSAPTSVSRKIPLPQSRSRCSRTSRKSSTS